MTNKPAGTKLAAFELPYPPSLNLYWRHNRGRFHRSAKAEQYINDVRAALWGLYGRRDNPLEESLMVTLDFVPPDNRRRDLDNAQKVLCDSLQKAGLFRDDAQIKKLVSEMHEPQKENGHVIVQVWGV